VGSAVLTGGAAAADDVLVEVAADVELVASGVLSEPQPASPTAAMAAAAQAIV
jgi:hypothetical protein